jgi:hypothetical protein
LADNSFDRTRASCLTFRMYGLHQAANGAMD